MSTKTIQRLGHVKKRFPEGTLQKRRVNDTATGIAGSHIEFKWITKTKNELRPAVPTSTVTRLGGDIEIQLGSDLLTLRYRVPPPESVQPIPLNDLLWVTQS